ncbi:MAG: phosphorothioated DNA-binding restriction endonuclease [Chthoniobacteraceae bacterium]
MKDSATKLQHLVSDIVTWKKGEQRAPHKPLMLLLAIGSIQRGEQRLQSFEAVEPALVRAMELFGPAGRVPTPQYPFWRLQHDDLWEVEADGPMTLRKSSDDPTKRALIKGRARAGFLTNYFELLRADRNLQALVVHQILDAHFPASIHEDLLAFFGLSVGEPRTADHVSAREFRTSVLSAYQFQCAVSRFSARLGTAVLGVESAHICWPQAGGLNAVVNGVALSTLHRKLFHLGVFTIDSDYRVVVSPRATGEAPFTETMKRFHGQKISLPAGAQDNPSKKCLAWHASEVFRG